MNREQIILTCLFGAFLVLGYGCWRLLVQGPNSRLKQRLQELKPAEQEQGSRAGTSVFVSLLRRVGQTAGRPFEPRTREERSALRQELARAGIYSTSAMHLVSGTKAICLAIGLLGGYFGGRMLLSNPLLGLAAGGLVAFLIPTVWLSIAVHNHQLALEHGLPDALDLMVICVESGLTLDAAMQRVGREIALAHPALARELMITHMENQMGIPRADAVRNLGRRTGCPAVQSLAAMLVQAERFGTGVAQALRVHAESLRIKRHHAAEEMAAKASVKMTFPLVLCVFPALLLVVGGPAMIQITRHLTSR